MISAPKPKVVLDYETFYNKKPPRDRLSILDGMCKESILYEIAGLNYRIKPKDQVLLNDSKEFHIKELDYFTKSKEVFNKYKRIIDINVKYKEGFSLFNRPACLFALEELVNSTKLDKINNFEMTLEVWESILRYLLAVNSAVLDIQNRFDEEGSSFEVLNSKIISHNELYVETNPIFTPYRGYKLMNYFLENSILSEELSEYLMKNYGLKFNEFVYLIMRIYLMNEYENSDWDFFYHIKEGEEPIIHKLSEFFPNEDYIKFITIRKSPFVNVGKNKYIITDGAFLLEKTYSQFINDFWFDWLKNRKDKNGKSLFNIHKYRGEFGYFFESYISEILIKSFKNEKHGKLLLFNNLRVKANKNWIEIADVYYRYGNKIIIGQVKSGSIYDNEKYGGSLKSLYKNDRDMFFRTFGVDQLVESIKLMDEYMISLDPKFPKNHSYQVFPCLIVNDKAFQTSLMPDTFNDRFKELISRVSIKKVHINSLSIIQVHDLERMEHSLSKRPRQIWDLLKYNHRDKRFAPPFYGAINAKLIDPAYSPEILEFYKSLAKTYTLSHS